MAKPAAVSASVIHVTVLGICMILVYSTLSGLAGVYSEYILKDKYDVSWRLFLSLVILFCCNIFIVGQNWDVVDRLVD